MNKIMTFEEYADMNEETVTERICEMHWELGLDTEQVYEMVVDMAAKENVVISNVDTVNYDRYLYDWYQTIDDKGVS